MSKKCFWVSEELPSDGQRSEIWNYHGVTEIIEDVGVDLMRRFDSNIENIESGVAAIRKMSND